MPDNRVALLFGTRWLVVTIQNDVVTIGQLLNAVRQMNRSEIVGGHLEKSIPWEGRSARAKEFGIEAGQAEYIYQEGGDAAALP